jgi:hypothetical protein
VHNGLSVEEVFVLLEQTATAHTCSAQWKCFSFPEGTVRLLSQTTANMLTLAGNAHHGTTVAHDTLQWQRSIYMHTLTAAARTTDQ